MVLGAVLALLGFLLLAMGQTIVGVVVLIAGVCFLAISWTISGFFSRMDFNRMMEEMKYSKK